MFLLVVVFYCVTGHLQENAVRRSQLVRSSVLAIEPKCDMMKHICA
jgi:hypothetical protein